MEPENEKNVIVRLKSYMAKKNVSVIEMAKAIKRDRNTIHNYLAGRSVLRVDDLEAMAEYLGVPTYEFFTDNQINTSVSPGTEEYYQNLLHEKDQRIAELKEQLNFLRDFYKRFIERDETE